MPFSKTSLQPARIDLASRNDELCPARALSAYLAFFTRHPALPRRPGDSLFVSRRTLTEYQDMSDTEFIAIVRDLLQRAYPHFDATQYAGHSFRRGGTSALKQWGVSDSTIQLHGRWRSDVYRRYIDVDHNLAVRLQATLSLPSLSWPTGHDSGQPYRRPALLVYFLLLSWPHLDCVISIGAPPSQLNLFNG